MSPEFDALVRAGVTRLVDLVVGALPQALSTPLANDYREPVERAVFEGVMALYETVVDALKPSKIKVDAGDGVDVVVTVK